MSREAEEEELLEQLRNAETLELRALAVIYQQGKDIVTALEDLNASLDRLQTDAAAIEADLKAALANATPGQGVDPAAVEAAAARIGSIAGDLETAHASTAPPTPTPPTATVPATTTADPNVPATATTSGPVDSSGTPIDGTGGPVVPETPPAPVPPVADVPPPPADTAAPPVDPNAPPA